MIYTQNKILNYNNDLLYQVISDVSSYNLFLPWVSNVEVLNNNQNHLSCKVSLAYQNINKSYFCDVLLEENKIIVKAHPNEWLDNLDTTWTVDKIDNNTSSVGFVMHVVPKTFLLKIALKRFVSDIGNIMIQKFEQRAKDIS